MIFTKLKLCKIDMNLNILYLLEEIGKINYQFQKKILQ